MIKLSSCELCPRKCGVDRNFEKGYCGATYDIKVAKAFLHQWEEPCISGKNGSGTIFFSNCNLGCVFCQNSMISHRGFGKIISIERLAEIMLELELDRAENINLVTPTIYIPGIREAIILAKEKGLKIPIIYNSSGYESVEALELLEGLIDIYLPDIKYFDDKYSMKYSNAKDYFLNAQMTIKEMLRQVGTPTFVEDMMTKGVMIRHLMLPGLLFDSKKIIDFVAEALPDEIYLNIMCQYTPMGRAAEFNEINKTINQKHYEALLNYAIDKGINHGYFQDFDSADSQYTPLFDLKGV